MNNLSGSECVLAWTSDGVVSEHELGGGRTLIGRAKGCDLCFPYNEEISRLHASITCTDAGWIVEDVTSRSGTFLNDERVMEARLLSDDDVIQIGLLKLTLRMRKHGHDTVDVGAGFNIEEVERRAAELTAAAAKVDTAGLKETADSQPVQVGDIPGVSDGREFQNYYELIGVPNFSADETLIHAQAKQRLKELRDLQDSTQSSATREEIEAVTEAMIWLTNTSKKRHYDEQLAQRLGMDVEIVGNRAVPVQRPEGWQIGITIAIVLAILGLGGWFLVPWLMELLERFVGQLRQTP